MKLQTTMLFLFLIMVSMDALTGKFSARQESLTRCELSVLDVGFLVSFAPFPFQL